MSLVLADREGPIGILTLNRPERRNALSLALMREMTQTLNWLARDPELRVLIVAGAGDVFSSGHDLKELSGRTRAEYEQIFEVCEELMNTLQGIPQPVIAEVQGLATAAGCQLVATCDLAIASERASFATPGVRIGLFCSTPMVALTRAIGRKRAMEMLLTGAPIDARTAADWGLINRVTPHEELRKATSELALRIASASACTVGRGKQAFYKQIDLDQQASYSYVKEQMIENALHEDAQEGISAFLQKREPRWKGR